ncbi:hypothetical protein EMCRGX_G013126 [Ephydatia muelleri]
MADVTTGLHSIGCLRNKPDTLCQIARIQSARTQKEMKQLQKEFGVSAKPNPLLELFIDLHRCREKVIHQVRDCIEEHWMDDDRDFQGEHEKCFQPSLKTVYPSRICHFLPRVTPMGLLLLWVPPCVMAPTGKITSECGEQQGDLLGPLLFSLALHKLVSSIDADDECFGLLLQAWYLDDGVLAGSHPAVLRAVHLLEELGPALGIHINLTKCEFFGRTGNTSFPPSVRSSLLPNLDILGPQRRMCEEIVVAENLSEDEDVKKDVA